MKTLLRVLLMVLVPLFGSFSCSGGDDTPTTPTATSTTTPPQTPPATPPTTPGTGQGTLRVSLTDKPSEDFLAVNVTVSLVRVHQSSGADEAAAGWVDMPVTAAMPVDLLTLRNGVLYELCAATLAAGKYQQIRLQLTPNSGGEPPYANSVVTSDGTTHPLEVPGGTLKIVHGVSVEEGTTVELILDFDALLSVKQHGKDGSYYLDPVIKASTK